LIWIDILLNVLYLLNHCFSTDSHLSVCFKLCLVLHLIWEEMMHNC